MERRFSKWNRKRISTAIAAGVLAVAVIGWSQRSAVITWYTLRGLARADEQSRQGWTERVSRIEPAPVQTILSYLQTGDAHVCGNMRAGLLQIVENSGGREDRCERLSSQLASQWSAANPTGQSVILATQVALVRACPSTGLMALTTLNQAATTTSQDVRGYAMVLAGTIVEYCPSSESVAAARLFVETGLKDASAENRLQAVRLAMHPRLSSGNAIAAMLTDSSAEVRRAAMLAVGPDPDVLSADDLLAWLHDPDPDVRKLCEKALRSRGLREEHLKLGKLMTDSRPASRLQVVEQLRQADDLEPAVWLRRLTHDSSSAIRAAAVRAAAEQNVAQLTDRIEQMAQSDPSPTVRQLAQYYLSAQRADLEAIRR